MSTEEIKAYIQNKLVDAQLESENYSDPDCYNAAYLDGAMNEMRRILKMLD